MILESENMKNLLKKSSGRKCSVCFHERIAEINSQINAPKSLRAISLQFGMSHTSVARHTQKCLNLEISALIKEKKIERAIDHYQEIIEQLKFAKELRVTAREYLTDPETGRLILIPRSDEIEVVYLDHNDLLMGKPVRKRAKLDAILEEIYVDGAKEADKWSVKHVDIRSFALDAIKTTDLVLDKIARLEGHYQTERTNAADTTNAIRKKIQEVADKEGTSYQTELEIYLKEFADHLQPAIKTQLASELVQ